VLLLCRHQELQLWLLKEGFIVSSLRRAVTALATLLPRVQQTAFRNISQPRCTHPSKIEFYMSRFFLGRGDRNSFSCGFGIPSYPTLHVSVDIFSRRSSVQLA
jgi:hypothetical protein